MKIKFDPIEIDVESIRGSLESKADNAVRDEVRRFFQGVLDGEGNTRHEWYKSQAREMYELAVRKIAREYIDEHETEIIDRVVSRLVILLCNRKAIIDAFNKATSERSE